MINIVKNIFILFKNFIVFFKKNILQLIALLFLVIVMIAIGLGTFLSNANISNQLQLLYNTTMNSQIYYKNELTDINAKKDNYILNTDFANANLTNLNNNNFFSDGSLMFHSFYPIEKIGNMHQNYKLDLPLDDASFEVWKITPEIIDNFNSHSSKQIYPETNKAIYGLIVNNNSPVDDFKLSLMGKTITDHLITMDLLDKNNHFSKAKVLLFYDTLHFFSNPKFNPLISTREKQMKLYFAQYYPDFFSNLNLSNLPVAISDPAGNKHICSINGKDPACDQSVAYQTYLNKLLNLNLNKQEMIDYINEIRSIWFNATIGSIFSDVKSLFYGKTVDIENENQIVYISSNDGSEEPDWAKSGYGPDGKTIAKLAPGHILISQGYAIANNLKIGQTFYPYGLGKPFIISGFSVFTLLDLIYDVSTSGSSAYAIWFNHSDYKYYFIDRKGTQPPQITYNRWLVGNLYHQNRLNPITPHAINDNLIKTTDPLQDTMLRYSTYGGYNGVATKSRLNIINSIVFTTTILLFISSIVLSFIIINKIIKNNTNVIAALKALGFRTRYMVTAFVLVFMLIFVCATIVGIGLAYGFNFILNNTYKFGNNLYSYDISFYPLLTVIVLIVIPVFLIFVTWFLTFFRCYNLTLDSMRQMGNKRKKLYLSKFLFINKLNFKSKISYRFASEAKLKILLTLFITIISTAIFYSSISLTSIFGQSQVVFSDMQMDYTYELKKQVIDGETPDHNQSNYEFINNHFLNTKDIVAYNDLINNARNKYIKINVSYDKDFVPTVDLTAIQEIVNRDSFKNVWIKAKDVINLKHYCDINTNDCANAFHNHNEIMNWLKDLYSQNEYYLELLGKYDGNISIGFQPYTDNKDNFNLVVNSNALSPISNNAKVDEWLKILNNPNKLPKQFPLILNGIKDYYDNPDVKNNVYIRPSAGPDPFPFLSADSTAEYVKLFSYNNEQKLQSLKQAITSYNLVHPANGYNPDVNIMPVYLSENVNYFRSKLPINQIYVNVFPNLIRSPVSKYNKEIDLMIIVGYIRNISGRLNFTNYYALNRYHLNMIGYMSNDYTQNLDDPIYTINQDFSGDQLSYPKQYLGVYLQNNNYQLSHYFKNKMKDVPKYEVYLNGLVNTDNIKSTLGGVINLLFFVILIICVILILVTFVQISVTTNIIIKDNINILNLFRCLGYSNAWIFNRLFTIYVPIIIISVAVALPIGIVVSQELFNVFTDAITIVFSQSISYLNWFICLLLICLLFTFAYYVTWKQIQRKYKIYQFVK